MISARVVFGLALIFWPLSARAELPAEVLDRDYQSCLAGDTDPARATYCACIRDGLREWDMEAYLQAAMQAMASSARGGSAPSGRLEDLAKQCIAKALH